MSALDPIITCGNCPIRHNAICAECEPDELAILERAKSYKTVAAGTQLARAGEPLSHFSSLIKGCAAMSRTLEDGRRQTVGLLLASDFIGRPGRAVSPFDVEALTEVTLCRFERTAFEAIVRDTPHVASRLLTMTLDELDAARDWAVVLGRMTAREKLAAFLLNLAQRQRSLRGLSRPNGSILVSLPMSREAMGDHLGLTIETISRQITALRKDGLIEVPGRHDIRILDYDALAIESGDDSDGAPIA